MRVLEKTGDIRTALRQERRRGRSIGFVPTLGALHAGHVSLVDRSRRENDLTAVSIFVNPTQFNDPGDLDRYPRTFASDRDALEKAGADFLIFPDYSEVYADEPLFTPGVFALPR